eukprot:926268-Rhodomonas_salina.2
MCNRLNAPTVAVSESRSRSQCQWQQEFVMLVPDRASRVRRRSACPPASVQPLPSPSLFSY